MRVAFNIALIVSVLYLPWWAGAIILISACLMVPNFYEAVLYGILSDALYGSRFGVYGFTHIATIYSAIVLAVCATVRTRLSW